MADWYYVAGGQQQGPVPLESLRQLAAGGRISAADIVWTEGMPAWQPASQVAGLMPAGSAPPPLPQMQVGYATPQPYLPQPPSIGDDPGTRWLIPVGRSGWAIAAGYLGLVSIIPFVGLIAIVCAILAIRDIRSHPHRHGMGRAIFGLVMGILFSGIYLFALGFSLLRH